MMEHTAKSLAGSAIPAQLEARITARHGNDARFAFLRPGGPFSGVWEKIRADTLGLSVTSAIATEGPTEKPKSAGAGAGLLAGYGSDSDSDAESDPPPPDELPPPPPGSPPPPPPGSPPPPPPTPPR